MCSWPVHFKTRVQVGMPPLVYFSINNAWNGRTKNKTQNIFLISVSDVPSIDNFGPNFPVRKYVKRSNIAVISVSKRYRVLNMRFAYTMVKKLKLFLD